MGWYQGGSAASPELYTTRIDLTGPSSGAGTIDGQWVIGPEDTKFWAAIVAAGDSSGHRIVFTAPDGVTEYAWKRTAWSYANAPPPWRSTPSPWRPPAPPSTSSTATAATKTPATWPPPRPSPQR